MKKEIVRNLLKVLAVGAAAALHSIVALGCFYGSILLFCDIPTTTGYLAVLEFAGAVMALAGAIFVLFMCGAWMVRKGRFSK